jgi:hypothetical protein
VKYKPADTNGNVIEIYEFSMDGKLGDNNELCVEAKQLDIYAPEALME